MKPYVLYYHAEAAWYVKMFPERIEQMRLDMESAFGFPVLIERHEESKWLAPHSVVIMREMDAKWKRA